jgi:hypothetical protein
MAWSKTDERTSLCLMAIAAGVLIGLVTIGFFFVAEAVSSQGGNPPSAETAKHERERDNFRRAVLLLFILACAALVVIGVTGIYRMHSPQAVARRRANELPLESKPGAPDS